MRGQILPREKGAAPLDVVIAIMAFLASLALGASLIANRAAEGWRGGLEGSITVQILPPENDNNSATLETETEAAVTVLKQTPGISHVNVLSENEERSLVAPWLGESAMVGDLPLPQLIDARIAPSAHLDLAGLAESLKPVAPDARVDDHSRWIARLQTLASTIIWLAYGILTLIAVATAATISFATRAGLEAHHDIVAILHQMGAQSGFIARAFEWHYLVATLVASCIGGGLAALLFVLAGGFEFAGIDAVHFLPSLTLGAGELLWLLLVPVVSGIIAWSTARLSVLAALRQIY